MDRLAFASYVDPVQTGDEVADVGRVEQGIRPGDVDPGVGPVLTASGAREEMAVPGPNRSRRVNAGRQGSLGELRVQLLLGLVLAVEQLLDGNPATLGSHRPDLTEKSALSRPVEAWLAAEVVLVGQYLEDFVVDHTGTLRRTV